MPNWCSNYLTIEASPEAIQALLLKANASENPYSDRIVEFSFLPFVQHLIPDNYKDNSYHLNCDVLIGCKWFPDLNHVDLDGDNHVHLSFETPWGPSILATRHLAAWIHQLDPNARLVHEYEEPGMAFCGLLTIDSDGEEDLHGECTEVEIGELKSAPAADLEYITRTFKITVDELRILAANYSELGDEETLYFYPDFYKDSACVDNAICLPERLHPEAAGDVQ